MEIRDHDRNKICRHGDALLERVLIPSQLSDTVSNMHGSAHDQSVWKFTYMRGAHDQSNGSAHDQSYGSAHDQSVWKCKCMEMHKYRSAHVWKCTCREVHMYESAHVRTCTCMEVHMYGSAHVRRCT